MKLKSYILSIALGCTLTGALTACDDMLDKGNEYVIYADDHALVNPSDTVTSVLGIINKLQGIAVRVNLFGELRGDLVTVNDNANSDLKDIANFAIGDDNAYNAPVDYYAVINNCNYYLAVADSTAGNTNRNELYFEREIAAVHAIRAWTYLELVKAYGKVPLVTEPVLTKNQSQASYPMTDIAGICEYFINDLQPYYGTELPDYNTIGGDIDPKMCFFPTQIVMGDLYLWLAATTQSQEAAKSAAKCYYDFITWDLSGKGNTYMTTGRWYWDDTTLKNGKFNKPSSNVPSSSVWGNANCTNITMIPMDSAAVDGYYNELRNLYNTTYVTEYTEASISPSDKLIELSEAQNYIGYYTSDNVATQHTLTASDFDDEALESHYLGDLRFQYYYSSRTMTSNREEYEYQTIGKHNSQHVSVYRITDLYLKLAEALNYAGYPRFAKQLLVMGVNNDVLAAEVLPYYPTAADSAFINYFQMNSNTFVTYANVYSSSVNSITGEREGVSYSVNTLSDCNMWGIHARGCGYAMYDDTYASFNDIDSVATGYPFELKEALLEAYEAYSEVPQPSADTLSKEAWFALQSRAANKTDEKYAEYQALWEDSVAAYTAVAVVYAAAREAFSEAYEPWFTSACTDADVVTNQQKTIDQLLLDESALEMAYEGHRYYDLMRRAYWWGDNTVMSETLGQSKLSSRSNWFISWDGQIGFDVEE